MLLDLTKVIYTISINKLFQLKLIFIFIYTSSNLLSSNIKLKKILKWESDWIQLEIITIIYLYIKIKNPTLISSDNGKNW